MFAIMVKDALKVRYYGMILHTGTAKAQQRAGP